MDNESILQASNYVDGEMDLQQQKDFELQMQGDAELREYVEQYREASIALKTMLAPDASLNNLKQTLGNLNKTHFKAEAKVVSFKSYTRWISGVAAVLILGLIVFNPWKKSLYEEYSTASSMSVSERGEGAQTNLEKAAAYYNKKDYAAAEKLLAKEYAANPNNSMAAYYYGITLIQDKQEAKARGILQQLYRGESAFKYDAAYYMALSYVKQNDKANARKWLKHVPPGTSNYTKAKELESKL
ncbi:tetratricopeptide repeat protein [Mucilaginibacter rigui]|uniref:Tetratricopeptide repeat protein n=1 Tax=Mucilaginibacter rigui TaxID=534635 RepID=A0ABR7X6C7_9SPHI|nr:tetratricopeptide repeat protein [Mucilaginibacter rigui]MBD1386138.1 tetratricopeptide repeat protein [Mucilaginibacter rigui]